MKNILFRKVLYALSILAIVLTIIATVTLPLIVKWYTDTKGINPLEGSTIAFIYLTAFPFICILFAVNRLSYSLLKDNCFNNQNLNYLKIISRCSLMDFAVYFIGTVFLYQSLICFVLTLATLIVATISWIIKELVTNGIELKEEIELTI